MKNTIIENVYFFLMKNQRIISKMKEQETTNQPNKTKWNED